MTLRTGDGSLCYAHNEPSPDAPLGLVHTEPSPGDPLGIMPVLYIIINKEEIRPKGGAV